ncbi:MAG TPA: glycosyltransferase family 2 protein [Vicinamibacterales bacterium]|nr:glycosyltransferase family 2 protein [Vicinamibacterales bacterium]
MPHEQRPIAISVVVPVLNESANVVELARALVATLEPLCRANGFGADAFEVMFVDDGSSDDTWAKVERLHAGNPCVGGLRLSRRFGHHLAVTAGLDRARGEAVVVMDGDLQDPPEAIPELYARHKEGYDLVYAIRQQRHDPLLKRINSQLFWRTMNRVSGLPMPPNQMMLRMLSRRFVNALGQMRESARFVHGMMAWAGFRVTTVEVQHRERQAGTTKYSVRRQLSLALYALTSFSTTPLRIASVLGLMTAGVSLVVGVTLIVAKFFYSYSVEGWASIMTSLFFLSGLQMFVLGIIGEYLGKTYQEVQRRPLYFVSDAL